MPRSGSALRLLPGTGPAQSLATGDPPRLRGDRRLSCGGFRMPRSGSALRLLPGTGPAQSLATGDPPRLRGDRRLSCGGHRRLPGSVAVGDCPAVAIACRDRVAPFACSPARGRLSRSLRATRRGSVAVGDCLSWPSAAAWLRSCRRLPWGGHRMPRSGSALRLLPGTGPAQSLATGDPPRLRGGRRLSCRGDRQLPGSVAVGDCLGVAIACRDRVAPFACSPPRGRLSRSLRATRRGSVAMRRLSLSVAIGSCLAPWRSATALRWLSHAAIG